MRATIPACALVIASVALVAQAPQPPPQPPIFRSGVGVVRLDVTVINREGDPVADLAAADFDVREDGVLQKVEWLQFVRVSGTLAPGDDTSLPIRSPEHAEQEAAREDVRLLAIFIDDYHLRHGPGFDFKLKNVLHAFVKDQMQPTDLFAVMGPMTPISDLRLTRNKQDIFDRIAKFQGRLGEFSIARSPMEEAQDRLDPRARARVRAQITLSALKSLVSYLSGLRDGRKSILFVSEGPPTYADGSSMHVELEDVITAANTGNVTIHTLDPRSLGVSARMLNDANAALANDTGGRELHNSNDYAHGLASVVSDSSTYYLLGYMPTRDVADGKFHKVDVKVGRKGLRVIARKGYWAPRPEDLAPRPVREVPHDVVDAFGALARATRPQTDAGAKPPTRDEPRTIEPGPVGMPLVYRSTSVATHRQLGLDEGAITSDRTFRRTDRVLVRLPIADPATPQLVRAELINELGQVLVTLPVGGTPRAPEVELPLANLAMAKYAVRFVAEVDSRTVSRVVAFTLAP